MADNERADIDAQINRLSGELKTAMPDGRRQVEQALALAYIARELNKLNFRNKFGKDSE